MSVKKTSEVALSIVSVRKSSVTLHIFFFQFSVVIYVAFDVFK